MKKYKNILKCYHCFHDVTVDNFNYCKIINTNALKQFKQKINPVVCICFICESLEVKINAPQHFTDLLLEYMVKERGDLYVEILNLIESSHIDKIKLAIENNQKYYNENKT